MVNTKSTRRNQSGRMNESGSLYIRKFSDKRRPNNPCGDRRPMMRIRHKNKLPGISIILGSIAIVQDATCFPMSRLRHRLQFGTRPARAWFFFQHWWSAYGQCHDKMIRRDMDFEMLTYPISSLYSLYERTENLFQHLGLTNWVKPELFP